MTTDELIDFTEDLLKFYDFLHEDRSDMAKFLVMYIITHYEGEAK